jgi:hypothetical protein
MSIKRGHSKHTIRKQYVLEDVIEKTYGALKGISIKRGIEIPFNWIDAYAGTGTNPEEGCLGSPVIFKNIMNKYNWPYCARCIDKIPEHIQMLKGVVNYDNRFRFYIGDNSEILNGIVKRMPNNQFGILYLDPNGSPNWDVISEISQSITLNKIDILIHTPATSIKRNIGAGFAKKTLYDNLKSINKKHWHIHLCHPMGSDAWQWIMIIGTNHISWNLKSINFHGLDTPEGQAILNFVNHTKNTPSDKMVAPQTLLSGFEYIHHSKNAINMMDGADITYRSQRENLNTGICGNGKQFCNRTDFILSKYTKNLNKI